MKTSITFKIVASGNEKIGSYRIPFIWFKGYFKKHGWKEITNKDKLAPDIYFCKGGQGEAATIRKKNSNAFIVLFKPHFEIPSFGFYLYNPKFIVKNFLDKIIFYKNSAKTYHHHDIMAANVLIADTRHIKTYLDQKYRKKTVYCRLVEPFPIKSNVNKVHNMKEITVLFHGSITHYNINFKELEFLLEGLSRLYKVKFVCISNLSEIKSRIKLKNVNVNYYNYEFDLLVKWLNKATIGYVPSFFPVHDLKTTNIIKNIFFKGHQNNMEIIFEKFSANAGRCYPFAHFGVPFLAHPTREVIADFSEINDLEFPFNKTQMLDQALNLIENQSLYKNISVDLIKLSRKKYSFENIAQKLMAEIENFILISS